MSKIDLRLQFAKEFGHSLDYVNRMAERGSQQYIEWLENQLLKK